MQEFLPKAELLTFPDADHTQTAIARGAALHAFSLAITGRGLVSPVAGDDISIRTKDGDHLMVARGTKLPTPDGGGMAVDRSLSVPRSSLLEPMSLRIELVRSDGRVLATKPLSLMPPFNAGEALEVRHSIDENQRLNLEVIYDGIGGRQEMRLELENPLSNVVNPNERRERLADLEERMRTNSIPKSEQGIRFSEIIGLHKELGQRQKASQLLKNKLKLASSNGERSAISLQLGMLAEEMRDWSGVEKYYRESYRLNEQGAPLFNLALSLAKRGENVMAAKAIDEALRVEQEAPYHVLRARIQKALGDLAGSFASVDRAFGQFVSVETLNDWELGWYLVACDLRPDKKREEEARAEQKRRIVERGETSSDEQGDLPAGPSSMTKRGD